MAMIGDLINFILQLYIYVIIASVAVSWLIVFEVINVRNPQAKNLVRLLDRLTDPVYRPLRRYIPPLGGIDITPIIVIFIILYVIRPLVFRIFY
jgi:YggT family protein